MVDESDAVPRADVGLCSVCRRAVVQRSARGNEFWRCQAAETDTRLLRYPPLPVDECPAFDPDRAAAGRKRP